MPTLKLVTLNILNDLSRWPARRTLLAAQMAEQQPDLIALQEGTLPNNNARWLADQLANYSVHLCPRGGRKSTQEGIAILSRLPVEREATLDLRTQQRVAQCVEVVPGNGSILVANTHLYWRPGESAERDAQVRLLLDWLSAQSNHAPTIVCGDFNAMPGATAIRLMRERFTSAYAAAHHTEPKYTCPTPLTNLPPRTRRGALRAARRFVIRTFINRSLRPWRGTLDYIFVNDRIRVVACDIALNKSAPNDKTLYPSDHFGLAATLQT